MFNSYSHVLKKPATIGFLFGSIGLFLLFGLALQVPFLQFFYVPTAFLLKSAGLLSGGLAASQANMLLFFTTSGALYGLLFYCAGTLFDLFLLSHH